MENEIAQVQNDIEAEPEEQRQYMKTFEAFLSTSTLYGPAWSFVLQTTDPKVGIVLKSKVTKGKNVETLSDSPHEKEIMLLPGTRYKVEKIKEGPTLNGKSWGDKTYVINLTQIS